MRSPGAVYTLVRAGNIDSTRPFTEMQSGKVATPHSTDTHDAAKRTTRWPATARKLKARASSARRWREMGWTPPTS